MNKKKQVGIVTLHGYNNYGNRLQNFALKYATEKLGYEVSTIILKQSKRKLVTNLRKMPLKQIFSIIDTKFNIIKSFKRKKYATIENNRVSKFKKFSSEYLSEKFFDFSNCNDRDSLDAYSYFITGSDQVWNPMYYPNLPIYFLTFTEQQKRIAYAASISVNELPKNYIYDYKKWFQGMAAISIREEAGAKIIKDLVGIEVPVLVDPTMLLTKEEWLSISKRASNRPNNSYLLTYFLGGPTKETRKKIEKIANEKNMEIINLGDITEKETYETGPSEFLDYINNAEAFFTDSFHGVVFSIIFQTPFVVYERISPVTPMYSRIETILDKFGLKSREASNFKGDIFSMDFSGTQNVLQNEYNKSISYLNKALSR